MAHGKHTLGLWLMAAVAVVFGAMTIKSGAAVLFFEGEARAAAGHFVGFVVWFNFLAGFAYMVAGLGLLIRAPWAPLMATAIALLTLLVFAALGVHILNGGLFEERTIAAMSLRSTTWVFIAILAYRAVQPQTDQQPNE